MLLGTKYFVIMFFIHQQCIFLNIEPRQQTILLKREMLFMQQVSLCCQTPIKSEVKCNLFAYNRKLVKNLRDYL